MTGLHTGHVQLRVEIADAEPPLDDEWEECVEVSFEPRARPRSSTGTATSFTSSRWAAHLIASGITPGGWTPGTRQTQSSYLLQFWPAPAAPDQIVSQTSALADYWHRWAQSL